MTSEEAHRLARLIAATHGLATFVEEETDARFEVLVELPPVDDEVSAV